MVTISNYEDFVGLLKTATPDDRKYYMEYYGGRFTTNYDTNKKHNGKIASSPNKTFVVLNNTDVLVPVKYVKCSTLGQFFVDALNDAEHPATLIAMGSFGDETKSGGNHNAVIYEESDGKYVLANAGKTMEIKADNMIDANRQAIKLFPEFLNRGSDVIYSINGEVAYNRSNMGDMTGYYNDKNDLNYYKGSLDLFKGVNTKQKNNHSINVGHAYKTTTKKGKEKASLIGGEVAFKVGDDKLHGEYFSVSGRATALTTTELGENGKKFEKKAEIGYSYINAKDETPGMEKKAQYSVPDINLDLLYATNEKPILNDNITVQGYVAGNLSGYLSNVAGECKTDEENHLLRMSDGAYTGDATVGITLGGSINFGSKDNNIEAMGYINPRLVGNMDCFEQVPKLRPELASCAKISATTGKTFDENHHLKFSADGLVAMTNSKYYNTKAFEGTANVNALIKNVEIKGKYAINGTTTSFKEFDGNFNEGLKQSVELEGTYKNKYSVRTRLDGINKKGINNIYFGLGMKF